MTTSTAARYIIGRLYMWTQVIMPIGSIVLTEYKAAPEV